MAELLSNCFQIIAVGVCKSGSFNAGLVDRESDDRLFALLSYIYIYIYIYMYRVCLKFLCKHQDCVPAHQNKEKKNLVNICPQTLS